MIRTAQAIVMKPFNCYNSALDRHPLSTKCLTSGVMYAGGDVIAQYGENYHSNLDRVKDGKEELSLNVNWKRAGIFFVFGTFMAGPAYHYWFNYLDELPAAVYRLKQMKTRTKILRAYTYLKRHNIEVKLDLDKIPNAIKIGKWSKKAIKIAADQLIFSTVYTLVFFMSIGCMGGAVDKAEICIERTQICAYEKSVRERFQIEEDPSVSFIEQFRNLLEGRENDDDYVEVLEILLKNTSRLEELNKSEKSFQRIFNESWKHTQSVYVPTYVADCLVWPPLQLFNFTFVPLRFQVLYVNVANLGWNTFLSVMANKSH